MLITGDVLAEFATKRRADLLITGEPKLLIQTLLNEGVGTSIGNIGDVISVKLTLDELVQLVSSGSGMAVITHIHLNRNVRDDEAIHYGQGKPDGGDRESI